MEINPSSSPVDGSNSQKRIPSLQTNNKKRKDLPVPRCLSLSTGYEHKPKKNRATVNTKSDMEDLNLSLGSLCYSSCHLSDTQKPTIGRGADCDRFLAWRIGMMKNYTPQEEEEEKRLGVSTRLELYHDPWSIKVRHFDTDSEHHLLLKKWQKWNSYEVGMFRDTHNSRLLFSVLGRR